MECLVSLVIKILLTSGRFEGYEYHYFVAIGEQNDRFRLLYENDEYDIVEKDFDYGFDIDFNFDGVNEDMTREIVCLMDINQIKLIEIPYTNLRQINNDYLKLLLEEYL